jgi:hypothetical protein
MKMEMFTALFTTSAPPFVISSLINAVRVISYCFFDIDFIIVIPSKLRWGLSNSLLPSRCPQIPLLITLTLPHARRPALNSSPQ